LPKVTVLSRHRRSPQPEVPAVPAEGLRLNVGCGSDVRPGYFHVDARAFPWVDLVWDIADTPWPLPDRCAREIICHHTLEHVSYWRVPAVLCEMRRVLRDDGMLELAVPNGPTVFGRVSEQDWTSLDGWRTACSELFGGQDYAENQHRALFDEAALRGLLRQQGFRVLHAEVDASGSLLVRAGSGAAAPRRMLVAGFAPGRNAWSRAIAEAFVALGWDVRVVIADYNSEERNHHSVLVAASEFEPHAFFRFGGWDTHVRLETVDELNKRGVLTASWTHDDPYRLNGFDNHSLRAARVYRVWFTNDSNSLEQYDKGGIEAHWLPCSCLPDFRPPGQPIQRGRYPISFIGTWYATREPLVRALQGAGIPVDLWLGERRGPDSLAPIPSDLRRFKRGAPPAEYARIVAESAINLGLTEQPDGRRGSVKTRDMEVLACGGFLVTGRTPDHEKLFGDGGAVLYDDAQDLVELAQYYLARPDERYQIAAEGHRRFAEGHSLLRRAQNISEILLRHI